MQLVLLGRRSIAARASTPWGLSQHAVAYADGTVVHSTTSHGGFALTAERNAGVPVLLRSSDGYYEEDCAWAAVAIAFPEIFTDLEKRHADETLRHYYPDAWEEIHGKMLEAGQSRGKDRRRFERENADRWVVVSAVLSTHRPGFVECVARLGGRHDGEQRRYLVAESSTISATSALSSTRPAMSDMPGHRASSAGARHEAPSKPPSVAKLKTRRPDVSLAGERHTAVRDCRRHARRLPMHVLHGAGRGLLATRMPSA
ncbi:hypothetical protein [Rhizobium sp. 007]|uniref:DUF7007 domain-containing protein n=1 Tax=Rhizobium sp. 007 TaxID=2785056 RepID=UPI0032B24934